MKLYEKWLYWAEYDVVWVLIPTIKIENFELMNQPKIVTCIEFEFLKLHVGIQINRTVKK